MIEVEGLSRNYGKFAAVKDVSFRIEPGEIVGLLGHNGAGKTTIMKMLTGFMEPSAGRIRINGVDVQDDALLLQSDMGYLPESAPIYPELTVLDYLVHAAHLRGATPENAVARAVRATGLETKAFDRIDTLSRGYKQRLGVAQAIIHEPHFLILDEPSNGLDPTQIKEMRKLIKALARNATVILSTHIMQEVNALCDRVLILSGGELVVDERLDKLRASSEAVVRTNPELDLATVLSGVLEGVGATGAIRARGEGEWRVEIAGPQDESIAAIGAAMTAAEAPIYHLGALARDLETVFSEVTEDAAGQPAKEVEHAA